MKGRDLVKEVVDTCRKYGLKVGLYFSPPDWYYDRKYINFGKKNGKYYNLNHELVTSLPSRPEGYREKRDEIIRNQVKKLLTNYGRVDIMWFDRGQGDVSNDWIREPNTDRMDSGDDVIEKLIRRVWGGNFLQM